MASAARRPGAPGQGWRVGSGAHALDLSADGGYLVVGTGVGAWVYDARGGGYVTLCRSGGGARESVGSVSISPDGSTVETGHEGELKLWDLATGARKGYLYRPGEPLYYPVGVFSPDGEVLASGQNDGSVLLWDVASGQVAARLDGHGRGVRSLAFTPDARVLATASADSTVRLWDVVSREALGVLRGHGGGVKSVSFSPDGQLLASGSADGAVLLWDVASREEVAGLRGVAGAVNAVSFASGGGRLAAALNDGTVRVWDVASWDEAAVLEGGGGRIGSVAYSRDGAVMAYGAVDGAVVVHDEATGRTRRLQGFAGNDAMAVSPGGTVVASGSWQGRVVLWDRGVAVGAGGAFGTRRSHHRIVVLSRRAHAGLGRGRRNGQTVGRGHRRGDRHAAGACVRRRAVFFRRRQQAGLGRSPGRRGAGVGRRKAEGDRNRGSRRRLHHPGAVSRRDAAGDGDECRRGDGVGRGSGGATSRRWKGANAW